MSCVEDSQKKEGKYNRLEREKQQQQEKAIKTGRADNYRLIKCTDKQTDKERQKTDRVTGTVAAKIRMQFGMNTTLHLLLIKLILHDNGTIIL